MGVKLARFTTLEIRGILFCTIVTYTFYNPFLKINRLLVYSNTYSLDRLITNTEKMSNQLSQANQNEKQNKDEVDRFVNSTGDFARLPQRDGETALFQFFEDKSKRELTTRTFEDPLTHEKTSTIKVRYKVLVPDAADQGEKTLPKFQIAYSEFTNAINKIESYS